MSFVTIITGNGIGRSINNSYFGLDKGIREVWNDNGSHKLSRSMKRSIRGCLPKINGKLPARPKSEDQLLTLQEVSNAAKKLRKIEPNRPKWLTTKFRAFPEAIDEFVAKVAYHFHCCPGLDFYDDYQKFVRGLSGFIRKQPSHIATLNYDNLLYQPFIDNKILDGYNGRLIDGFWKDGFKSERLNRVGNNLENMGWYLHLHGSPLFYDADNGAIKKYSQSLLHDSFEGATITRRHVVLCHTKNKPDVIAESRLLRSYWRYFGKALRQSKTVYILGYGGDDEHLNKKISDWAEENDILESDYQIRIIERKSKDSFDERKDFWVEKFSSDEYSISKDRIKLKRMKNILKFDWSKV